MVDPTPLRKEGTDATDAQEPAVPGIDATISIALDEKRAMQMRTMFTRDDPPEVHERGLAAMFSVGEVIRLRERLIAELGELANAERRLQQLKEGDPDISAKIKAAKDEINSALTESASLRQQDEQKFRASERQGDYLPQGAVKNKLAGFAADIEKNRAKLGELEAEVKTQVSNCQKAIEQYKLVVIPNIEAQIKIRRESYAEK